MSVLFLFTIFESFLFPRNILLEDHFNPAKVNQNKFEIIIGTEIKYNLSELRTHTIYSQIKSYSISAASFGNDLYRENVVGFGFSFPVALNCAAGIKISALNYWIKYNYSRFGYSLRMGAAFKHDLVEIGIWFDNVNVPKFSDVDYLPFSYSLRCNYLAMRNLSFNFAVRAIETDLPFFNFGLFYSPYRIIELGAGINTEPMLLEYGLKMYLGEFVLTYAGSNHRQLGLSHHLSIGFGL